MSKVTRNSVASSKIRNGGQATPAVLLENGQILVANLAIPNQVIVDYLQAKPVSERADHLIRAAEVGVFCLERAGASRDLDFVRQQIAEQVKTVVSEVGRLPALLQVELVKKIGVKDGQVLAPVLAMVNRLDSVTKERVSSVQKLLNDEIDPRRQDSTLGKALATISALFDPKREDSVQNEFGRAVASVATEDGALASVLKAVLADQLQPFKEELTRLGNTIRGQEAAEEALSETTAKGTAFEEELVVTVQCWAKFNGASVEHVGRDNDSGDIVITVSDDTGSVDDFLIVIEARDEKTPRGKKQISDDIGNGLANRAGQFGLYVAKTSAGLAKEIGDWSEGKCSQGPYVACTANNILVALRWAVLHNRYQGLLRDRPQADVSAIQAEMGHMRTALRRIKTVKNKTGQIRTLCEGVNSETDALYQEIEDAMLAIESALRGGRSTDE
jgi:hypothetical protein